VEWQIKENRWNECEELILNAQRKQSKKMTGDGNLEE